MISSAAIILIVLYSAAMLLAAGCSNRLMFPVPPASYKDSAGVIKLKTPDGASISAVHIRNPSARYTILFSHGNAEDLGCNLLWMEELSRRGFSVFAYDYHGYGTSEGKPSEDAVYSDIDAAYEYLTCTLKVPPQQIIVYGRSIGGGPSIDLASRKKVAGLVMESNFTSAYRVITKVPLLPGDKFCNIDKIGKVACPVLAIHGRQDRLVPFSQGQQLYDAAKGPKQCLWVDNAGHNTCIFQAGESYYQALSDFSKLVNSQH